MIEEEFTITADGRKWTRTTLKSAKALADSIVYGGVADKAVVTLTETGWIEYSTEER